MCLESKHHVNIAQFKHILPLAGPFAAKQSFWVGFRGMGTLRWCLIVVKVDSWSVLDRGFIEHGVVLVRNAVLGPFWTWIRCRRALIVCSSVCLLFCRSTLQLHGSVTSDDSGKLTLIFYSSGGRVKTWKRRWFILTDNCLYYFEYTTDKEPRGIIPLENLSIREVEDKKPYCFELFIPDNKDQVIKACKTEADGRVVEGNHTFYRISAPTIEEKDEWMNSIKAAISRDPFYEVLAARKKKVSSVKRH